MKAITKAFMVVVAVLVLSITVGATEMPDISNELSALDQDELYDAAPSDAMDILEKLGIDKISPSALLSLKPLQVIEVLWDIIKQQAAKPLKTFMTILGMVIICSLIEALKDSMWQGKISLAFDTVAVLSLSAAVISPIVDCVKSTANAITECSDFLATFIPVYAGVITASGKPVTGTTYNLLLFWACQVISRIASTTLLPLVGIYLGICIVASLSPGLNISSATGTIKSLLVWAMGLMMTMFVGLMTIQSVVASSSDSVAVKTTKFLIGSFVPVVGSSIADAFVAAQGCIKLLKTAVGSFGLFVALFIFLPTLLRVVIWYLTLNFSSALGELMGIKQITQLLKSTSTTLGILMSMMLCFGLLIIISTTMMMLMGAG